MKPPPETAPPKPVRPTKAKIVGGKLKAEESINFSDLESTRYAGGIFQTTGIKIIKGKNQNFMKRILGI